MPDSKIKVSGRRGGMSVGTLVFIVLFTLKLTGTIQLGWFWVISSIIWAPICAVSITLFGIFFISVILAVIQDDVISKRKVNSKRDSSKIKNLN